MNSLSLLALVAGAAIATQATMNAKLGVLLDNSLMATSIAFLVSSLLTITVLLLTTRSYPQMAVIKGVPSYLWISGGLFSAFAVAMFYFLIPKMGVGSMMSYALSGQILIAVIASHFGWFELPVKPLNSLKIIGTLALMSGVLLLNWEPKNGY